MRTTAFTLLARRAGEAPLDVFVCHQAAESAVDVAAPQWKAYPLDPNPACKLCVDAAAA